jgi:uncharacterized protein (TIGR03435 family)
LTRDATLVATALFACELGAQTPTAWQFEVVSVKRNLADDMLQLSPTLQPGGRVFAMNLPLRDLVAVAYGLEDNELIFPSPLADARFDLDARAGTDVTNEQAVTMLRALLSERFGLRTHAETRQLPVYVLARVHPTRLGQRIKPAGPECAPLTFPSVSAGLPPPPPPPPPSAGTSLGAKQVFPRCPTMFFSGGVSARSIDMYSLSTVLARMVRRPVLDKTGLMGEFDIDLTFTPERLEAPVTAAPADSPPPGPVGPATGAALATALSDQLGLRLDADRAPVQVLVVDDVRPPAEN